MPWPESSDDERLGFAVDSDAALPNLKQEEEMRWLGLVPPLSSSDSEPDEQHRAKRRRRETNTEALGLSGVLAAALHPTLLGSNIGLPTPASRIEDATEAEASLLAMEVQGLLAQARPDSAQERPLLRLLEQIACLLRGLPTAEVQAGNLMRGLLADLDAFPVRPLVFRAPTRLRVVGSFPLRATLGPNPCVDLAMEMPISCFDDKDELNHRYHIKRALYLSHVAAVMLRRRELCSGVGWECLADDPRRPVVVLTPPPGLSPGGFRIRLLPMAPADLCSLARLGPNRNCLRSVVAPPRPPPPPPPPPPPGPAEAALAEHAAGKRWLSKKELRQLKEKAKKERRRRQHEENYKRKHAPPPPPLPGPQLLPTPHYNTTLVQCRAAAAKCRHFAEGAALLRAWAQQQQLSQGADGLNSTVLTMMLVHLVEMGQVGETMPAILMLRLVLMMLSNPKTFSRGLFMLRRSLGKVAGGAASGVGAAVPPDARTWRKAFEVAFVDSTGWLNLAASLSKSALAQARIAAAHSIRMLNMGTPEAFDAVFATRQRLAATCDYWFHVRLPPAVPRVNHAGLLLPQRGYSADNRELLQDVPAWRAIESQVESLATKALGNRARLVRVFRRTLPRSPLGGGGKPMKESALVPAQDHILLGVQVDASAALRTLDMGPSADRAKQAAAFRAFWGDKAELRRFQDGAIAETVMWEDEEAGGAGTRHHIVDSIVSYILLRHLPAGTRVTGHADALDVALQRKHSSLGADVQAARLCEAAAERLSKRLRSLVSDSLPLRVVAVQPLAAVLRHAAAFPPLPHLLAGAPRDALASEHVARCLEPVELLCQLEGSGKWPDELEPYKKMKAALGCQLAQQLHTTLGLDASATEDYVDVLTDGFAFRLLLATERDAAMQQMALDMAGARRLAVEEDMPMRTWHQGAISGVAGESPAFEPSVRLAKRWVGAHLLSPHVRDEAVELLVVSLFTSPGVPAPASRLSGLLRFLQLLAEHPWRVQPLIVDPSRQVGDSERQVILREHAAQRQQGGMAPLCIITPHDPEGGAWTSNQPTRQMLHRIVVLAQRSAAALEALLLGHNLRPASSPKPALAQVGPTAPARETTPPVLTIDEILKAPPRAFAPPPRLLLREPAEIGAEAAAAAVAAAEAAAQAAAQAGDAARAMLFSRDLGEYDAIIQLRGDALPNGANDLRLAPSGEGGGSSSNGSSRPELGPALQAANEQLAALSAAVAAAGQTKGCRAILRGIPSGVLAARGHHLVRRQVLVGFDPLPLYTQLLQRRLGDLAVVCADWVGGRQIALKWRSPALAPASLRPEAAHLCCPTGTLEAAPAEELSAQRLGLATADAAQQQRNGDEGLSAATVVPDLVAVLADALQLCEGLVESACLQ